MPDDARPPVASPSWLVQALIEGLSPDTMGAVDHDLRYIALNEASRERLRAIYGRDFDVGDSAVEGMSEAMAEASRAVWERALAGDSWVDEFTFGDLETRTFRSRFYPLRDPTGTIVGAAGWGTDVTDLVAIREDLEKANAALEQFVALASHDLRAPLRGVATYAGLLRKSVERGDADRAIELAGLTEGQVERMRALLDDLLHWARVHRAEEEHALLGLDDVVDEALRRLADRIGETGATIQRGPLGRVPGTKQLLVEAVVNLVENALKYTDEVPRIEIDQVADPRPALRVRDHGIGMEPDQVELAFRFFHRLHAGDAYGGGTGVGLPLVKEIVEEHHDGELTVETAPGEGTTFLIALPRLAAATTA